MPSDFRISDAVALTALFVLVTTALVFLTQVLAGWGVLARRFPVRRKPLRITGGVSARLGRGIGYNRCVRVGWDEQGLFLGVPRLLSFGPNELQIPWAEITLAGGRSLLRGPHTDITFSDPTLPGIRVFTVIVKPAD